MTKKEELIVQLNDADKAVRLNALRALKAMIDNHREG